MGAGWQNEEITVMVLRVDALVLNSAKIVGFFDRAVLTYHPDKPQDGRLILDPTHRPETMVHASRLTEEKDGVKRVYYSIPAEKTGSRVSLYEGSLTSDTQRVQLFGQRSACSDLFPCGRKGPLALSRR